MADGRPSASTSDELRRQAAGLFGGGAVAGLEDGELLARFVRRGTSGDIESAEAAFAALVARHGGMVLGVCRRALRDPHDAEDAFQAVFLVLARKAGSVRVDDSLGRWLYGVSRKVAARARRRADSRRRREITSSTIDAPEPPGRPSADGTLERDDLRETILAELARLPGRYREAIEACDLDGCTHEQAALRLGWPVGTVRSRLARGREQLRGHLARRGLGLPIALHSPSWPVPPDLASQTSRLAARSALTRALDGTVPIGVAILADGVLSAMSLHKPIVALPAALLISGGAFAAAQYAAPGFGTGGITSMPPFAAMMGPSVGPRHPAEAQSGAQPGGLTEAEAPQDPEVPATPGGATTPPIPGLEPAIRRALEREIPIPFETETPLIDVLEYIHRATADEALTNGLPIYIDEIGLQEAGQTLRSPVKLNLEGIRLKTVLTLILDQLDLDYTVYPDLIEINSEERVASQDPTKLILDELRALREEVEALRREVAAMKGVDS